MKKIMLLLFLIFSILGFSKDNYIFDENRIKQVFSEYELVEEEKSPQIWLDLCNREKDIRIQISNYKKGDSKEAAKQRFYESAMQSNFLVQDSLENLAQEFFAVPSISYIKKNENGIRKKEDIFLDKVKVSIEYVGEKKDYEKALELLKEAIDPNIPLKTRTKKIFNKNYSIDNYINKERLMDSVKSRYKNVTFYEEKGSAYDQSIYKVLFDEDELATRVFWIASRNNYSDKVILRRWENSLLNISYPYRFRDEEKKITPKYFGVAARTYYNDYVKKESKLPIIGIQRIAMTKDFIIYTLTYETKGNKKRELQEYEIFLQLIKDSMK